MPLWVKIVGGVVVAIVLLSVGVAAGGGPAKVETRTVAGPRSTVTATATVAVTSTVTATPPAPTATVTTTFTPVAAVAFTEGTFAVPSEVAPGTYHTDGDGTAQCYWARLGSLDTSDIKDNNLSAGPQTIQVQSSDAALQTRGGCSWSKVG